MTAYQQPGAIDRVIEALGAAHHASARLDVTIQDRAQVSDAYVARVEDFFQALRSAIALSPGSLSPWATVAEARAAARARAQNARTAYERLQGKLEEIDHPVRAAILALGRDGELAAGERRKAVERLKAQAAEKKAALVSAARVFHVRQQAMLENTANDLARFDALATSAALLLQAPSGDVAGRVASVGAGLRRQFEALKARLAEGGP